MLDTLPFSVMRTHGHKEMRWPADFPETLIYDVLKVMAFHLSQPPRQGLMTPDMTLDFQEVCQAVRKSFRPVYFPLWGYIFD
ncbi:hypothetical protein HJ586_19825 [Dickeya zeae]|nr:hypothetical protein HJ586_19825 [Dickeya zeae]